MMCDATQPSVQPPTASTPVALQIRKASNLTQQQLAVLLNTDQGTISRIERRDDLLMSTLREYLWAAGARHPRIVVDKDGVEIALELDSFAGGG